jgi:hypothetical protein
MATNIQRQFSICKPKRLLKVIYTAYAWRAIVHAVATKLQLNINLCMYSLSQFSDSQC